MTPDTRTTENPEPRTEAEVDLCDVLYHSEFHISREQAAISGRLMHDAMLARGWRFVRAEAAQGAAPRAAAPQAALDVESVANDEAHTGMPASRASPDRLRQAVLVEAMTERLSTPRASVPLPGGPESFGLSALPTPPRQEPYSSLSAVPTSARRTARLFRVVGEASADWLSGPYRSRHSRRIESD